MLKELFIKIQTNLKDYTKEELIEIEKFIKEEIVLRNTNNEFELNSKYKIATLKIEKNFAILEDLVTPLKNIKIELDELNGAFDGDLVIAKRVFNPKSKIKAKIIKIISSKKAEILVYVKDRAFYTVKENIRIENKKALTFNENDVLVVDNKSFEVIKNVGNISDSKVDEFISLYLYKELYRLEKLDFEIDAKMDDKNQRVDLRELPFCTI
ncbi:ribonuclease R, partial [Aliarcobacter butzleri]